MKQLYTLLFILSSFLLFGQVNPPCPSNTTPASDICAGTCTYCNFNGMQSSTDGYGPNVMPGFMVGELENAQFMSFLAQEVNQAYKIVPSNCQKGEGLQAAIYSSCTGNPLTLHQGFPNGGDSCLYLSVDNLTPGKSYFLMVDGKDGDICDFMIFDPIPHAITPLDPPIPTVLHGSNQVCTSVTMDYCIDPLPYAAAYTWIGPSDILINGQSPPVTLTDANCVTVEFGTLSGVICVNGVNSCFTGPPQCWPFVVQRPNPVQDVFLCPNDTLDFCNQKITREGVYCCDYPINADCDSSVCINVKNATLTAEILGEETKIVSSFPCKIYASNTEAGDYLWTDNLGNQLSSDAYLDVHEIGWYFLQVSFSNSVSTCTALDSVYVELYLDGNQKLKNETPINIYPTIGKGYFTLETNSASLKSLQVIDVQGNKIHSSEDINSTNYHLNLANEKAGMYMISVLIDGRWVQKRIVKM